MGSPNGMRLGAFFITCLFTLTGCSSDSDSAVGNTGNSDSQSSELIEISGVAMKGAISNGLISASMKQAVTDRELTILTHPIRTEENGEFTLSFNVPSHAGGGEIVVLELSSDTATEMVCDVSEGCRHAGTSSMAAFGEPFSPGNNLKLSSLSAVDGVQRAYLTPLSTLAVELAKRPDVALTAEVFARPTTTVESWFGIPEGTMAKQPLSLTHPASLDASQPELELALVNAAFLSLAADSRWSCLLYPSDAADE